MPKVEVVHATSPLCGWSWGFEPVINRLEMLYGKQVQFTVTQGLPYVAREKWLEDYEMNAQEAIDFQKEIAGHCAVPMWVPAAWTDLPASCYPAAAAVKAAGLVHGPHAERRLTRHLMNALFVEKRDTASPEVLESVVLSLGLDNDAMLKASGDEIDKALGEDMHRGGHSANFYSLIVRDPKDETRVVLERAYDPARVESAIEWMGGGKIKRNKVKPDVVAYAKEHGLVSLPELRRAFALDAAKAKSLVAAAEKAGALERRDAPGIGRFWRAA